MRLASWEDRALAAKIRKVSKQLSEYIEIQCVQLESPPETWKQYYARKLMQLLGKLCGYAIGGFIVLLVVAYTQKHHWWV